MNRRRMIDSVLGRSAAPGRAAAFGLLVLAAAFATGLAIAPASAKDKVTMPKELPAYGADRPMVIPQVTEATLPNGLIVWIVPRAGLPKVAMALAVRGGWAADGPGMDGFAGMLADALTEGTATRTSQQIAEQMQALGGEIGASGGDDAIIVNADGFAAGAPKILNLLADVARNASFPDKEVDLVKTNTLQRLQARKAAPEFAVSKAFAAAVYGDHPYHIVTQSEESVAKVTPAVMKTEFARRFRPDRAILVVAGAVDVAATRRAIDKEFGTWKAAGEAPKPTPPVPPAGARRILLVDRPGSVQSQIRIGRPAVRATEADYYPLLVANAIFGGAFTSRLTENIREDKGYTYSPSSRVVTSEVGGLIQVDAAVRNDVTSGTLLEVFYELDRMGATLPTDEELARAKRYQTGLFLLRNEINGSLVQTLASNWVKGLPLAALADYVPKVNAVTAERTRDVARRYMTSRSQTVVIGGDVKSVSGQVEPFGAVTAVTP
jgi:predicted Zn-dependent peptidase